MKTSSGLLKNLYLAFFLAILAFFSSSVSAESFEGRVVAIGDGDTVTVLTDYKRQIKVRLYGIDCPESNQAFGHKAKQFTGNMVFQKRVKVYIADTDHYGRTVGIVSTMEGTVLNRELLANGLAWFYTRHCKQAICQEWLNDEQNARNNKIGLWKDANPTPPWQFRKNRRTR